LRLRRIEKGQVPVRGELRRRYILGRALGRVQFPLAAPRVGGLALFRHDMIIPGAQREHADPARAAALLWWEVVLDMRITCLVPLVDRPHDRVVADAGTRSELVQSARHVLLHLGPGVDCGEQVAPLAAQ
jgi:hypothetical protein